MDTEESQADYAVDTVSSLKKRIKELEAEKAEAALTQCVTCDCFNENDKLKERIEELEGKTYGWCNTCGSLVVGPIEHLCDKCGGGKVIFEHEFELVRMKQALKGKLY